MNKNIDKLGVLAFKYFRINDKDAGRKLFRELIFFKHNEIFQRYSSEISFRLFEYISECWSDDVFVFTVNVRDRDHSLPRETIEPAWESWQDAKQIYQNFINNLNPLREFLLTHGGVFGVIEYGWARFSDWFSKFLRIFKYLAICLVVIPVVFLVYDEWSKSRERERIEKEKESVGVTASIAGNLLWQAYKSCAQIGIRDVNKCANYRGELLQEMTAQILAKQAILLKNEYWEVCGKFHSQEYCSNLINRAVVLSQNSKE